jgi:hypothetical protein
MVITGKTTKETKCAGFRRGLNQVRVGDYAQVREELMTALGVSNRNSLAAYASGRQEMKVTQAEAVEGVFNRFGVTSNIWGV